MSSTKIIGIVIGLVVVGGLVYMGMRNSGDNVRGPLGDGQGESVSGSIGDLLSRGGDWKCTWSFEQDGVRADGAIRMSGNKFRTDMESTQNDLSLFAYSVSDGEFIYAWTDLAPFGTKMNISVLENGQVAAEANPQAQMFGDEYAFDCDPWTVDASAFVPPSGITFMEAPVPAPAQ